MYIKKFNSRFSYLPILTFFSMPFTEVIEVWELHCNYYHACEYLLAGLSMQWENNGTLNLAQSPEKCKGNKDIRKILKSERYHKRNIHKYFQTQEVLQD